MNKKTLLLLAGAMLASQWAHADNIIRFSAPIAESVGQWQVIADQESGWRDVGDIYACSNWTPDVGTVSQGVTFTQTATDCVQLQEQTIQARQQNSLSHIIRNVGSPQINQRSVASTSTRDAIGTKPSDWQPTTPLVSGWTDQSSTGCSLVPASATLLPGQVTQSRSCTSVTQTRTTQQREYNQALGTYRNVGVPVVEQKTFSGVVDSRILSCAYSLSSNHWTANLGTSAVYYGSAYGGRSILGRVSDVMLEKVWAEDGFLYVRGAYRQYTGAYYSEDRKEHYVICQAQPATP